jgi:hypothetical protein
VVLRNKPVTALSAADSTLAGPPNPTPMIQRHPIDPCCARGMGAATGKGFALDLTVPLPELLQPLVGDGVLRRSCHGAVSTPTCNHQRSAGRHD